MRRAALGCAAAASAITVARSLGSTVDWQADGPATWAAVPGPKVAWQCAQSGAWSDVPWGARWGGAPWQWPDASAVPMRAAAIA